MVILNFIKEYIQHNEYAPTVREIGDHFGMSVKGAQDHLMALMKKGFIKNKHGKSRTIIILKEGD
jgi:repressor LexA